jgi:hypothetical protein
MHEDDRKTDSSRLQRMLRPLYWLEEPDGSFTLWSWFPGYTEEAPCSGPPAGGYPPEPPKQEPAIDDPEPELAVRGEEGCGSADVTATGTSSSADDQVTTPPNPLAPQLMMEKGRESGSG